MKTIQKITLTMLAALAVLSSGCISSYTSIQKADEGSYYVTSVTQSIIGTSTGTLYKCDAEEKQVMCTKIDRQP